MNIQEAGFWLSIIVNIVAVAYFTGRLKAQSEAHTETLKEIKKNFKETIDEIKKEFKEKLQEFKDNIYQKMNDNAKNFKEHIDRLEEKQDKHNSVIERTYKLENIEKVHEEQIKVANHRIEDLEHKLEN